MRASGRWDSHMGGIRVTMGPPGVAFNLWCRNRLDAAVADRQFHLSAALVSPSQEEDSLVSYTLASHFPVFSSIHSTDPPRSSSPSHPAERRDSLVYSATTSSVLTGSTTTTMGGSQHDTLRANWKCVLACLLVSMSPFQYGVDFGLIGGIQGTPTRYLLHFVSLTWPTAMIGFMKVFGYAAPNTPVGWNISAEVQQLIGSLMTLGAMVRL